MPSPRKGLEERQNWARNCWPKTSLATSALRSTATQSAEAVEATASNQAAKAEHPLAASAGRFHILNPGTPSSSFVRAMSTPEEFLLRPSPMGEEGERGSLNEKPTDTSVAAIATAAAEAVVAAAQHDLQQRFEVLRKELWASCQATKSRLNHQLESFKIELLSSRASATDALIKEAVERRKMESQIEDLNDSMSKEVMARRAVNTQLEVQLGEQAAYLNDVQAAVHKALIQCPHRDTQAMSQSQLRGLQEQCERRFMEERVFLEKALREHEEQTEFRFKRALRMVAKVDTPSQQLITFGAEPSAESVQVEKVAQETHCNPRPQYVPRCRTRSPCDKSRYVCMNGSHNSGLSAGLQ
mmetsp:Transcript_115739/g.230726  ORF Transcript_115739/g.230726 Transcript_115739/m.230726 type:complete len:356 (+) Transcript_115739:67-1134(+)